MAGPPFQRQAIRKRVSAFASTGCCNAAGAQLLPPSAESSTLAIRPEPDQASPETSYSPGPCIVKPGEGWVITDLASIGKTNCSALPLGSEIVYFDVSSLVIVGASVSL